MMRLDLPWPPSVNTYWRHVVIGGRVRVLTSGKGRKYRASVIKAVAKAFQAGAAWPLGETIVHVAVDLYPPDRRQRDIDNYCKGLLDGLKHAGLWADDSQVKRLELEMMAERVKGGLVRMAIQPIDSEA